MSNVRRVVPALSISLDEVVLATVSCVGLDVVAASVSGTRIDEEFATLGFTGGSYPGNGESAHFIWVNEVALLPGQRVGVSFLREASTSHQGLTIDELFPDGESTDGRERFEPTPEMFDDLRGREKLREGYLLHYASTPGTAYAGRTSEDKHGFGLTVLWNSFRPERVSVSLHSYALHSVEKCSPGQYHVQEHLQVGHSVSLEIKA
jgi:hypothetical protein